MTWFFELLNSMSPTIVTALKSGLKELFDKLESMAAETPNKWDDWGVGIMRKVLKVDE